MASGSLAERIEDKTMRRGARECWPWLGHISKRGQARIWVNEELGAIAVPAAICLVLGKTPPDGKKVLSCPILKDCANPDHHSFGTKEEISSRRLWTLGWNRQKREPRKKLSDEDVRQIFLSPAPTSFLATEYNTTRGMVSNIRAGRKHRRVTDPLKAFQPTTIYDLRKETKDDAVQVREAEEVDVGE